MKALTVVVALCAMLALAHAADGDKAQPAHDSYGYDERYGHDHYEKEHKYKAFSLYPESSPPAVSCNGNTTTCGRTIGFSRKLYRDSGKQYQVAVLYQTGMVAATGATVADTRLIYWQSFRFSGINGFGEGTIQTQGDDTGFDDPTFTNRAITGGTGVFTGVKGWLTRGGNPATTNVGPYTFVFTNWDKDGGYGGYHDDGYDRSPESYDKPYDKGY